MHADMTARTFKHEHDHVWCQLPQGVCSSQVELVCAWLVAVGLPADLHGIWLVHHVNEHTVGQIPLEVGET
jgi:hypothetical protein